MAAEFVEQYDRATGLFVPRTDLPPVTILDILGFANPMPEDGKPIYLRATIYDIGETVVKTLKVLGRRYPGSLANVCGAGTELGRIAEAHPDVTPVMMVALPPEQADRHTWQDAMVAAAHDAGFKGALLTDDNLAPTEDFPDMDFYRVESLSTR